MKKILVAATHQGPVKAVIPIVKQLRAEGIDVTFVTYDVGSTLLKNSSLLNTDLAEYGFSEPSFEAAKSIIESVQPDLILTGQSFVVHNQVHVLEQQLWADAKSKSIPTISVCDMWANRHAMFHDYAKVTELGFMSDIITTIDDTQSSLLIREGFDSERLYITGNPSFDMLPAYGANFTDVKRSEVLSEFGLDAKTLFFYAGTSFESDSTKNGFWDLDNIKVFHEVFVKLTSEEKKTCGLVVKLHPRQPKVEQDKIKAYISTEIGGDNVLFYTGNISMSDIICATDLTVTSVSTSAIEAINLGHPAVSLQPGLTGFDDLFFATNSGKIGCAYTHDDAVALLLNAYRSSEFRAKLMAQSKSVQTDGLATKRVVDLVYATLGK